MVSKTRESTLALRRYGGPFAARLSCYVRATDVDAMGSHRRRWPCSDSSTSRTVLPLLPWRRPSLTKTSCTAQGFRHEEPGRSEALLLDGVENYFRDGASDPTARVQCTKLPPIYFQHAGESRGLGTLDQSRCFRQDGQDMLMASFFT